ncbi:MAG: MlaD family protein [Alphaproteobacteria bacterium]|nr:MlaD family protein [Alphaproteobacteria bacterium]
MKGALSVGILVLVGVALAGAFLLFFSQDQLRRGGTLHETYIRESVQGLEVGASVRFRGVAVGRVTQISLASAAYRRSENEPFGDAFQLVLVRFMADIALIGQAPEVEQAVELGLRARLSSQGLTGVGYIELDFVDVRRFPAPRLPWQPEVAVIPSMPSTSAQVQSAAEMLLSRVQDLDLNALVSDIASLVGDLRRQAGPGGNVATVLEEALALLRGLRGSADSADLPALLVELQGAATAARRLLEAPEIRTTIAQGGAAMTELRSATQRLPATIQQLDAGVRSARSATLDLQADMMPILRDLRAVTANLREVTEALRRSPGQAILGAPPPAPVPAR